MRNSNPKEAVSGKRIGLAALATAAALACAGQAGATVMVATFGGATNGFTDTSGTFGNFHESGFGTTSVGWQAVFTYDTDVGHAQTANFESSSGALGATFTLMGMYTIQIGGTGSAYRYFNQQPYQAFGHSQSDGITSLSVAMGAPTSRPVPPLDGTVPYFYLYSGGPGSIYGPGFHGSFYVETIEVHALPVPEPTAWALMILGLGGIGAALRRRRYADSLTRDYRRRRLPIIQESASAAVAPPTKSPLVDA